MYELVRVSMHDWYAFQAKDVDVAGTIGLIGRSGSGKSTVEDAILTVMLGANENHLSLNAAAGGKAGDRTLKGYCLCSFFDVDEGSFRRDEAETTLVLTFRDRKTEAVVACGVMMTADRDLPGVEIRRLFVAPGLDFRFSDHLHLDDRGRRVLADQDHIYNEAKATSGTRFQAFSTKQRFVEAMLLQMNPNATPNASRYMRALSQCRFLKEIGKPSEFVRRFVLDDERLRIDDVRASIARWRNLEDEVGRIRAKVALLRDVVTRASHCVREQLAFQVDGYRIADLDRRIAHTALKGLEEDMDQLWQRQEHAKDAKARADAAYEAALEERGNAQRTLDTSSRDAEIERVARDVKRLQALVEKGFQAARKALAPHVALPAADLGLRSMENMRALNAAFNAAQRLRIVSKEKSSVIAAHEDGSLLSALVQLRAAAAALPEVRDRRDALIARRAPLAERARERQARYEAAKGGHRYLPQQVEQMLSELARAGIGARVLSDLVRVRQDRWAPAVAMVLNREETAILVPADKVEDALRVQRRMGERLGECRIVMTDRLQGQRGQVQAGSLADMCETDDPEAAAFVASRLGRIMAVETEADLRRHQHAITPDGLHVGGLVSQSRRAVTPRLGRTDSGSLLAELATAAREAHEELAEVEEEAVQAEALLRHLANLAETDDAETRAVLAEFAASVPELRSAEERHAALGSGSADLRRRLADLDAQVAACKAAQDAAVQRIVALVAETTKLEQRVEQVQDQEADCLRRAERLLAALAAPEIARAMDNAQLEPERRLPEPPESWADASLAGAEGEDAVLDLLKDLRAKAEARRANQQRNEKDQMRLSRHAWKQFCDAHPDEPRQDVSDDPVELLDHAVALMERTSQNFLIPFEAQVRDARATMEASLKEDLLAKMGDKLESTARQLRDLNRLLMGKSYVGGYHYSFAKSVSEDHKDIIALIEAVVRFPDKGLEAILSDETLSDGTGSLRRAMARIEEMLENGKDVETLADYRRYFDFRIEALAPGATKPRDFAELAGKLSGGEKEAPYYVAIAATMRSVYYPSQRAQATPGMAVVVLDEAFSKLDVVNTRKLIDHFNEMGLQLVIAAPDNNLATFMQCADSVMIIHRPENSPQVTLEVQHPKEKLRRELARRAPVYVPGAANPAPAVVPFGKLV